MSCSNPLLEIEALRWGGNGDAVGRLPEGKTVFLTGAIPGERVLARVVAEKKRFAQAKVEQVLEAAPERVQPSCAHFGLCGGCVLQHMTYPAQLRYKQDQVRQALARIGGLEPEVRPTLAAEAPWGYRNRVVFHVQRQPELAFGLYQEKSRRLIPGDCPLLVRPLRELARKLADFLPAWRGELSGLRELSLRCDARGEEMLLTFVTDRPLAWPEAFLSALTELEPRLVSLWENSGPAVYSVYGADWRRLWGREVLNDRLAGVELALAPAAFLQVNHSQAERLYARVKQALSPLAGKTVLDVYSGVGSISLFLAQEAAQVVGVESYPPSVAAAEENRRRNAGGNCRFLLGAAETVLPELAKTGFSPEAAVVDPPRAGCAPEALSALLELAPARLVYVSCDPATLARDLAILTAGQYRVESVQPVDMFPQTGHIECVVAMTRNS